ncbi:MULTISPECIES: hypothetical protein [Providencia]|uniref:Uncharacterized protein n=1 Tax=Providencia huashanensis TaxID=3037798 RepID=A0ABT9ALU3_9GAMM|nr:MULTISPECIES: hypothetical protein [unclassified Providencia]MDO7829479.1 hypothetical protein [Providencia sp. CRE-138-0026]MDO7855556.1 hypothetical protein [Providencia sp. CRE-138-0111]
MKKTILALLFFPLLSMANTKDVVMDYLRVSAQYQIDVTDWYKKNDTWLVDFKTKENEKMKVTISGNRVAVHSLFPKPITDIYSSGCASIAKEVIPEAGYWDENATENTKAINRFWNNKEWSEPFHTQETVIDGWKLIVIKKPNELSCVIEPTTI